MVTHLCGDCSASDPRSAPAAQLGEKIAAEIAQILAHGLSYAEGAKAGQAIKASALSPQLKATLAEALANALCAQPLSQPATGGGKTGSTGRPPQSRVALGPVVSSAVLA
jgi:hypothetical protein